MEPSTIIYPTLLLAGLTFYIALWLGKLRFSAVKKGDLHPRYYELNRGGKLPEYLAKVSQNYDNLLEMPILFYVLVGLLYVTQQVDTLQLILAWVYVVTRIIHSFIHTTYNNLRHRMLSFLSGSFVLLTMWVIFAVRFI